MTRRTNHNILVVFHQRWQSMFLLCLLLFSGISLSAQRLVSSVDVAPTRPKIGLALSGGGAKGFAHIGVLKVLRAAGIEPDYISGTSMGAIVGGLYAVGYSPQFIDNMVRTTDWNTLLMDKLNRKYLELDYRNLYEQQLLRIPIGERHIKLPSGIKYGQNISLLFSKLGSVQNSTRFAEFNTPFVCIGTNIVNGKSDCFETGYLSRAMRASMAIPTVFTPQAIGNKLYVDGGLVNNFPVKELKDKGCDIIIGVDVQTYKCFKPDNLNSMVKVLDRSAGFYRQAMLDTAMQYVDYYINPDIKEYSVGSFTNYDSIILRGERAALPFLQRWTDLADSIKKIDSTFVLKVKQTKPIDTIVFHSLHINGEKHIEKKWIKSHFQYKKGDTLSLRQIEENIKYLYGGLQFNAISYALEKMPNDMYKLILFVNEADLGSIGLHIHYDNEYKAGLLLYARYRNFLFKQTLAELVIGLSENPVIDFNYKWRNGGLLNMVFNIKWSSFSYIDYLMGKRKIGEFRLSSLLSTFYLQKNIQRKWDMGVGLQLEVSGMRRDVGVELGLHNDQFTHSFLNAELYVRHDSWNHNTFPTKGIKWNMQAKWINEVFSNAFFYDEQLLMLMMDAEYANTFLPKCTLRSRLAGGVSFGESYYFSHMYYLGGQSSKYLPSMVFFNGLYVGQLVGNQVAAASFMLQYNFYKQHYLLAYTDVANSSFLLKNMLNTQRAAIGYGVGYGYDSPIGPIQVRLSASNYNSFVPFVSLGLWL